MILCNINYPKSIPEEFKICVDFINEFKKNPMPLGRHDLENGAFVNIVEYQTEEEDKCIKEAHRKYIDVHFMLSGTEIAKHAFIDDVKIDFYKDEDDYVAVSDEFENSLILKEGDMFVAYPEDAHLTRVCVDSKSVVKKLIFKIPV